jgi:asparagine synthase (glutamine-hydrolysing)
MCGIVGIIDFNNPEPKEPLLRRMLGLIRHRGPDSFGIYVDKITGLGSARLSIIDLSGGDQPIHNEDQSVWIVYNGDLQLSRPHREPKSKGTGSIQTRTPKSGSLVRRGRS